MEKHVVSFRRKMIFSSLFSLLFSFLMVLGYSFSKTHSFQFFDNCKSFISFCVISLIAFGIMYAVLSRMSVPKESELSKNCRKVRHPFFSAWVLIIVAWIPYYALFAPGLGFYDSLWQLSQFYGYTSYNSQHPVLATLVIGVLFSIGQPLGANSQFFIYTSIQVLLVSAVLAFIAWFVYQRLLVAEGEEGINRVFCLWCVLVGFSALNPLFPLYSLSVLKDVPYAAAIAVMTVLLVEVIGDKKVINERTFVVLFSCAFMVMSVFRNEGLIIAIACAALVSFVQVKDKKKLYTFLSVGLVGVVAAASLMSSALISPQKGSRIEMLTIPVQQISREVRDNPSSFTADEKKKLNEMLVDDALWSDLGAKYSPELVDPVKVLFRKDFSLRAFLKVWGRHLVIHPDTYLSATFSGTFGFFYPCRASIGQGSVYDSFQWMNSQTVSGWKQYMGVPDEELYPTYLGETENLREKFLQSFAKLYKIPVVNLIVKPGTYFWIGCLAICLACFKRNYKLLIAMVPCVLVFCVCLLSPVNESARYALPLVFSAPVLLIISACMPFNRLENGSGK